MVVNFLKTVGKLKHIPRIGWLLRGKSNHVESVAEHSMRTAVAAILMADLAQLNGIKVNVERTIKMAVLHDMAEALVADIDKESLKYLGSKGEEIKKTIESKAIDEILSQLPSTRLGQSYAELLKEYRERKTVEAKIVKAADKLETAIQALEYKVSEHEFLTDAKKALMQLDAKTSGFIIEELKKLKIAKN